MGKSIRPGEKTAWDMDDFEVKISKIKQPSCLVMIEVLHLMEVCQVLVISEDLNGKGGAMEIVSPGLQSMDDCKEFPVVDVVVPFCRDE